MQLPPNQKVCKCCGEWFECGVNANNAKYCDECRISGRAHKFVMKKNNYGTCTHCGEKAPYRARWCKKPECQAAKQEYFDTRKKIRELKEKQDSRQTRSLKNDFDEKKKNHKRICKRCKKNAYPNWNYCPACWEKITNKVNDKTYSVNMGNPGTIFT